jgi:hypothetical protein
VNVLLIYGVNSRRWIIYGTVFDGLPISTEVYQSVDPSDGLNSHWRDQYLVPRPPVPGINHEIVDAPITILDEKILDMANLAITGVDVVSCDLLYTAESWVALGPLRLVDAHFALHQF